MSLLGEITELDLEETAELTAAYAGARDRTVAAAPPTAELTALAELFTLGNELTAAQVTELWQILCDGGNEALFVMRFLWKIPLARRRIWLAGLDTHLGERYPMFQGLSVAWPAMVGMGPYIRPAAERSRDFGLVNQGYIGYIDQGYSLREVELFVWLEALRDRQCADHPCELGKVLRGHSDLTGGCPVGIHISEVFNLLALGKFAAALEMLEECNPLPNVTGRVCPQELQCQGVCIHKHPMSIGQVEWFLPEWEKRVNPDAVQQRFGGLPDPWDVGAKEPIAVVGSGPSGLINAYLLAREGYPVTVFEAFHELGGVLRYGIPEFRLPNELIDDVVAKIRLLGGRFVTNFVVGKTATLQQLRAAGFSKIFVGTGAGLPRFLNVPGEHLLNVMSANEFLTRVNLMHANESDHETPLPEVAGKNVLIIGGGNTAMDAARTARRLGGKVQICYRRTQSEMPARVEELEHALEEGIELAVLRSPVEFLGDERGFVKTAVVEIMELGETDSSGRARPVATGQSEQIDADLVIMALGNTANPILKDSEPALAVNDKGVIVLEADSQQTSISAVYTGGDAARGGSTAIRAAGDGRTAAQQMAAATKPEQQVKSAVASAAAFTAEAQAAAKIVAKRYLSDGIAEFVVTAPVIARSAAAGQFVRVYPRERGELIPLTLADWDQDAGTITLVVQGMGVSSLEINAMEIGDTFAGIAGPLGRPSHVERYLPISGDPDDDASPWDAGLVPTVVFTAGGLGLPPVYPIMREHLRIGNHVTLIAGFRSKDLMFWTDTADYVGRLQAEYPTLLDVIYTTNDGSAGVTGFVTVPLKEMLEAQLAGKALHPIAEVIAIGPPLMMRSVSDFTKEYGTPTVASLNSIMVDATGMCGACMVPVHEADRLIRKHACIDGPEIDAHTIDWDKFLPRFTLFKSQELAARQRHGM